MQTDTINKIGSLVPEFYYDLICRITPGALFCFVIGWHYQQVLKSTLGGLSSGIPFLLVLVLSYLSGFLLDLLSASIFALVNLGIFKGLKKLFKCDEWIIDVDNMIWTTGEHQPVITKIRAENTMLHSLCILWIIFWIGDGCFISLPQVTQGNWIRTFVLVVLIIIYYRWEFVFRRSLQRASKSDANPQGDSGTPKKTST